MRNCVHIFLFLFGSSGCFSCSQGPVDGAALSAKDRDFIERLGLCDAREEIILFDTQFDLRSSGNLITNKRLAAYWIEAEEEFSNIDWAFYEDIDSLKVKDLSSSLSYASYLEVHRRGQASFRLYVDGDKEEEEVFFEKALL
ncbi:MAG: hypothetical protein NXI09_09990 [Bacteroidetes bacterium]|nr:hypothetical protein [Bacteroidota bacterium]